MTESKNSFSSSSVSRTGKVTKTELRKIAAQHENLMIRVGGLKDALTEKDLLIKSQRNTIKMYEDRINSLEGHNGQLKHIIGLLSCYITEELHEALPPLPQMPEEESLRFNPASLLKNRELTSVGRKRKKSKRMQVDVASALNTFAAAHKISSISKPKTILFDENMKNYMYQDFQGAETLKSILDVQLCREEMKKIIKFLLGKTSKDVFLFRTRTILFETLSLFLSLKNLAYQNSPEVFLPRVMEMLIDVLEVQRVILYVFDKPSNSFFSKVVTCEAPSQIVCEKGFGHFRLSDAPLVIHKTSEDSRYDNKYDQISGFIATNLALHPIKIEGELLGLLECCNKDSDFTKEDISLLGQVTRQLGLSLLGETLKSELDRHSTSLVPGVIQQSKESLLLSILKDFILQGKQILNCERLTIFTHDSSDNELVSFIASDLTGTVRIPMHKGLASLAFTSNKLVNVDNASTHAMFNQDIDRRTGFTTREVLAVKIPSFGVLQALNRTSKTAFTKADEVRITALAGTLKSIFEAVENFEGLLKNSDINEVCLQVVNDVILQVNMEGLLMKVNKSGAKLFKLSPEKMVGANVCEILEQSPELLLKFMQTVREFSSSSFKEQKVVVGNKNLLVNANFLLVKNQPVGSFYIIILKPC
jgi:adenylate cyclase